MGIFDKVFKSNSSGFGGSPGGFSGGSINQERRVNDIINRVPVRPDGVLLVQQCGKKGPYTLISGEVYAGNLFQGQMADLSGRDVVIRSIDVNHKPALDARAGEVVILKVMGAEPEHIKPGIKLNFSSPPSKNFMD